ncbi:MAG: NADH:ubiquinone oxidoreductase [Elusimicrobia bacterium RIFOXYA2_FULL_50_26]|nr:MAG: NADH:ubiquinone oxidoreductase [Elusimicrobia bacterium RIFOXYA2_FULL_50_26]
MQEPKRCVIPIGPYHPLQEEPEFFKLHVDGEKVTGIDIELGYNHRGIEKLSEAKHFDQGIFLVERICGICSTSHPFAFVNAVEDLAGIEIPERAKYIRTVVGELERVHSHLLWLGLAGHFLGYNTVWMWSWKYREPVLDIFEKISGNRQHYAMMKVGGVRRDIALEDMPWIEKTLDELVKGVDMFKGAVMDDPVIWARTKGIGILTPQDIKEYGGVGPLARASGIDEDVRRDDPYAAYNMVDWKVQTWQGGDIFAKAVVRILELYESVKIIRQCLTRLKTAPGPFDLKVKEIPAGEGIGRHEAPRGEVFHYVRSDRANRPVRHKIRAPSYVNVATNEKSVIGCTISDALIVLAAVDPCYCCTERVAVVDAGSGKHLYNGNDLIRLSHEKTERLKKQL